jgi:hypothetical protein
MTVTQMRTTLFAAITGLLTAAATIAAPAAQPAKPTTGPATQPTAAVPAVNDKVPDSLTGPQLAMQAQMAFNRGEYAKALPMLKKAAAEAEGQPAKQGAIQERIRVCEKALAALKNDPNAAATAAPAAPAAEARKPHAAPKPGETYDIAIKDLGNFEYDQEKGGNLPADVKQLSGANLRMHGFMIPMDQAENITQFALVPSLFACCYGQPPQIQHTIVVNCPKGNTVTYCPDEIIVEGTLKVDEKTDDGYIVSLFEMQVSSVKPAPK